MGDLKKFDVRYAFNGLIVIGTVILVAAMHEGNRAVTIIALGLIGLGFGVWVQHSPSTYIDHVRRAKWSVIEYEPKTMGWMIIAVALCAILFGAYRLVSSP